MFYVITYNLKNTVKPSDVLAALDSAMASCEASFGNCLFTANEYIIEFESEGKLHSNREKNSLTGICMEFPQIAPFYNVYSDDRDGQVVEEASLCNFSVNDDITPCVEVEYETIREIAARVPKPYNPSSLHIIFNGVCFSGSEAKNVEFFFDGVGFPPGNYIAYDRTVCGNEKHSYLYFSADDDTLDSMRAMFFEVEKLLPGTYKGTENIEA